MKPLKVLLVSPFPPPFGGIASYTANLFEGLVRKDISIQKYDTSRYEKLRFYNVDKKRNYIRIFQLRNLLFVLAIVFDWIPFIITLIKTRCNIVHVHTSSFWGWWRSHVYIQIAKVFRRRTILHLHNAIDRFYFRESGKLGKACIRRSLNSPDHLVTLSDGIKNLVSDLTTKPITPIYNGVWLSQFTEKKQYTKPVNVLFAGFVGAVKGVPDLLKGLKESNLTAKDIKLTVMGAGDIDDMKALAHQLDIEDRVVFTGRVNEEDKKRLFSTHHVLALPSHSEGQPIAILEGLASGMAVLSTTVGSIPEVIEDGVDGYLVTPGDTKAIAGALIQLCDVKLLKKMGEKNRQKALQRFTFERVVEDNFLLYSSMIKNK